MNDSRVTVVMSTFNEERDVDRSLDAVLAQTVVPQVVVVDGGSRDGTVAKLQERAAGDPRIRVHADGIARSLPAALNLALEHCTTPFVAKVDARTFIEPDFLERALDVFSNEGERVGCVGGRPEQYGDTRFGEGFARARMSPFGVGASGYADTRDYADVDTVQCGVYRRSALLRVGGFDPELQYGEDEEVNWRLRQAGYRIVRDERIRFRYVARPTWKAAFTQYRNYGRARVNVWRKHPDFVRPHHLAPSLAILGAAALAFGGLISEPARALLLLSAGGYAAGALVAAWFASDSVRKVPFTAAAFSALHLGYGLGLIEGVARHAPALRGRMPRTQER
ncbi:MAG TPA: glycosyltransferase [Candidatus Baltobacteraceae bacterium]|nr:glycosyltransferase [Candidatus Baltobacteraceae bacterium]